MKNSLKPVVSAVLLAMVAAPASAVDFSGYVRAGIGIDTAGGGVQGGDEFQKQKLGRLGNEFDTYSEIGLGQELFNDDGKSVYFQSMFEMSSDGFSETEKTTDDSANFSIKQLNMQAKGYIAAAPEAVVWAGKRFYQRHDLHIIDTKYWNVSGYGFGLEGVQMGPGALSTAIIRGDQDGLNINYVDVRYAGMKPWQGAWVEVGIDYGMTNPTDQQEKDNVDFDNGLMLTAELSQSFSMGYNKTVLQYMDKGLAQNAVSQGGGWYDVWSGDVNSAKGYRLINTGDINIGDNIIIDHVFTYGYAQDHGVVNGVKVDDETLLSLVARPTYNWSKYNKTVLELGYFTQTKKLVSGSESKTGGNKVTISQVLATGEGFFARPEIRFYASYFKDTEGKSFNVVDQVAQDEDSVKLGVQIEAWW